MPLIDNLLTLYKVDRQVRSLQSRVESAQLYLKVQTKLMTTIAVELSENELRLKQHKSNIAVAETETGSIDARVERLREDLNKAVNDKEYKALLAEVNTLKDQRKAFEDEMLIEMASVETLDTTLVEITAKIDERKKITKVAEKELHVRQDEIAEQLAELEKERATAASVIPADILEDFDEIADDYEGESMASIEIIDKKRKEYSCNSCSLHLPLESIVQLMANDDTIVKCGQCDRILFLEQASKEALAPSE
jgi:predicted  nucleic acid-binding Zn-ribbon protein